MEIQARRLAVLLVMALIVASCAHQPMPEAYDPPGFFSGVWHGMIAGFALIAHIFNPDIRIYAFPNSGGWYDFGFLFGIAIWGAGAGAGSRG